MRSRAGLWGLAIFSVGLAFRAVWWPRIFTAQGMMPPHGADSYYHLRRILYTVWRYPEVLERDPYVAYPAGGEIVWPPAFDFAVAWLARGWAGLDVAGVEAVAAWVPAVLGALTAVAIAALGARLFSPAVGVVAGLLLALMPAHYGYSQLGKVDHHAAVSLLSVLLVMGCAAAVRREPRSWAGLAAALGIGFAGFLYTWAGGLLLLGLLQALAAVWMFQAPDPASARRRAWHLALVQLLAAAALAPYALGRSWEQYGSWSPLVLCSFQPVWFAATGAACASFALAWRAPALGASAPRRWLAALALTGVALLGAFAAVPELAASLDYAAGWFGKEEDFQLEVSELLPLFADVDGSRVRMAETRFSRLLYVFPLALAWLGVGAWRRGCAERWLLVAWAGAFGVAVLAQVRFVNAFAAPYALVAGAALVAAFGWVRDRPAGRQRGAAWGFGLALLLWSAWPSLHFIEGRLGVWRDGQGASASFAYVRGLAYRHASRWLAAHSPPTSGWFAPEERPEYAVLAPWDVGHLVRYEARRPQVQDNLGVYVGREQFLAAGRYYASPDEARALQLLDALGVRYVMVDSLGSGHGAAQGQPMSRKLYQPDLARSRGRPPTLASLARHRMVFETPVGKKGVWHLIVYEVVPGARIVGTAPPGAAIEATLPVFSAERREPLPWRARVRASEEGVFQLRVPYANNGKGRVRAGPRYRLHCAGDQAAVVVTEAEVQAGKQLPGPALACRRGAAAGLDDS